MGTAHLACLDGIVGPAAEARIPVTDDGVLRGDGAFEVLRLYDGRPFALEEHLERIARSAANLRLPIELAVLRSDVERLLAAAGSGPEHGCLRIVLTRGGRRLLLTESSPEWAQSIRLATVTYAPTRLLDGVKSLSYAANMLATRLAQERGADEALLVTPHGRVLEAPTSSIFWARGGALATPPLEDHILASITRARVIELSGAQERSCTLDELLAADELFLVSTTREAQAISAVDDRRFQTDGPIFAEAARRLHERILAELG
jgi:branched-chain amino acid aminotransferase